MYSEARVSADPDSGNSYLHQEVERPAIFAKGKSADHIRSIDWSATALGRTALQDTSFLSALQLLLGAQVPMFLTWGSSHCFFYNDAFAEVMALSGESQAAPYRSIFPEAWSQIAEVYNQALSGQSVYLEDLRVPLMREGQLHNSWWTISNSPVYGKDGQVAGVFGVLFETTSAFWTRKNDDPALDEGDSGHLLRQISETDQSVFWVLDLTKRDILGVNVYFRDLWRGAGFKDHLKLDDWLAYVSEEDRLILAASFEKVAKGEAQCHPFKARVEDGGSRQFHLTAFPLSPAPQASACIGAVVIEVTSEAVQRAYLIEPDPNQCERLEAALKAEGFRIRVFDSLADYQMIVDDLLPGVTLVSTALVVSSKPSSVTALIGRGDSRPWIAYGAQSHRLEDVVQVMKLGAVDVVAGLDDVARIAASAKASAPTVEAYEDVDQISEARRRISELPRRERQVFNGLVEGKTNKLIAQTLSLSPRTVETYRAQMMERLGVRTLSELLQLAALR